MEISLLCHHINTVISCRLNDVSFSIPVGEGEVTVSLWTVTVGDGVSVDCDCR